MNSRKTEEKKYIYIYKKLKGFCFKTAVDLLAIFIITFHFLIHIICKNKNGIENENSIRMEGTQWKEIHTRERDFDITKMEQKITCQSK